jgi:hypothetical protein
MPAITHVLAFAKSNARGLHHSSWDVDSLDDVGLGAELIAGEGLRQGLGRRPARARFETISTTCKDPWGSFAEYSYGIDFVPADVRLARGRSSAGGSFYVWGPPVPDDFIVQSRTTAQGQHCTPDGSRDRCDWLHSNAMAGGPGSGCASIMMSWTSRGLGPSGDADGPAVPGAEGLAAARAAAARAPTRMALSAISYLPPVVDPGKAIAVGLNYVDHAAESPYKDAPKYPVLFHRFSAVVGGAWRGARSAARVRSSSTTKGRWWL